MAIFGLWISGSQPRLHRDGRRVFALIPIGLIQVVLLPAAGWLIFKDHVGWGIFSRHLVFYSGRNVDTFIRPMLISRGAKIPFLVVLLGVLGGLAAGGIIGLFVGATLLSVFYTILKEWVAVPDEDSSTGQNS